VFRPCGSKAELRGLRVKPDRASPEELARELRVILRVGLGPGRLAHCLDELTGLRALCGDAAEVDRYVIADAICRAISRGVSHFGDGAYGVALSALFGTRGSSRGLRIPQRRREAANELGIDVATLIRHREREMIFDLAVDLYLRAAEA
jgi:hypothetical protein